MHGTIQTMREQIFIRASSPRMVGSLRQPTCTVALSSMTSLRAFTPQISRPLQQNSTSNIGEAMKKEKAPIKGKLLLDRGAIPHLRGMLSSADLIHVAGGGPTSTVAAICTERH